MQPLLYGELVGWYRLIDPPEDHRSEAAHYRDLFERAASGPVATLLELGAGAGHNATHLKTRFTCTLTDLSEGMRALARERTPNARSCRATCAPCGSGGPSTRSWCMTRWCT
jgi:trans-aconitate methyltransferase